MKKLETGLSHSSMLVVEPSLSARNIGSGDMDVLATPAMLALMENAAMLAVAQHLDAGQTTVGSRICSSHIRPSCFGAKVLATAILTAVEGRKLTFSLSARDEKGLIGEGEHVRYIVDRQTFLEKAQEN